MDVDQRDEETLNELHAGRQAPLWNVQVLITPILADLRMNPVFTRGQDSSISGEMLVRKTISTTSPFVL